MAGDVFEQRRWLARVRQGDGTQSAAIGAAFAIDSRHLVTCAHVVQKAVGTGPGARVALDFLFDDERRRFATVLSEGWQPEPAKGEPISQGDVAILRIDDTDPDMTPLPVTLREPSGGGEVIAYGFPAKHQESNVAEGIIGPPVGLAWRRVEQTGAAPFDHGFSGGAVWSLELTPRSAWWCSGTNIMSGPPTPCRSRP